jgi:hypothetical protein
MTFRATRVEVEEDGKDALTCDPKEELDEEVAKEVVGVATHFDMAHVTSCDQGKGHDEENDSIGKMEGIGDDSSVENSLSTNGNMESMDLHDYIIKFESSRMKNKKEIRILKEENLELSTQVAHLSEEVVRSIKDEDKL